ncbi:glycoside hydrolase family 13 protein [Crossiella sp. CA-258035]|uniref:glycoside hydrolase family 13 protein n=1 Tax=Crossiella sp. CA-258035 TaxID=2981138 RepID=UPI0024BCC9AE|nr:glycoside hydrolase family 13 protein [Crossiella sp. CA-258035]WHT21796.1 glycoside hydrolase family 13 protein [Crossiella sp. CA-258035]
MPANRPWWRDAVIYQVYIRSFADHNGDGIGDINGIRSRLPHLRTLGVDALWITPWYPSPQVDGGYDISDHRGTDPLLGTLEDAEALLREAHELDLRVIVDLVPNHTSSAHPWFQAALAAGPGSPQRQRYHFRPGRDGGPPNDWRSVFGGPAWTEVDQDEWYLHLFAPEQPDLNWANPEVRAEYLDILRFWLDRGVDGFRIDVAHALVKHPDLPDLGADHEDLVEPPDRPDHPHWDRPEVHEVYRDWRKLINSYPGERVFVAEAWVAKPDRLACYVRPDELHTAFNFDFLRCSWDAKALRSVIEHTTEALRAVGAPATWVLSNHDVPRHLTRFGRAGKTRLDGPKHDPHEPVDLELGERRARAAALLMFALPGNAYVYQGEELGLWEVEDLPEELLQDPTWHRSGHTARGRDGCRVPLPWSGTAEPFGFGPSGAKPWLPQPARWRDRTVAAQTGDERSMLELYRHALALRAELPALGDGELSWVDSPEGTLVFDREPGFRCAVNLGADPLPLPADQEVAAASAPLVNGELPPEAAAWLVRPGVAASGTRNR